jgi:hypothetical protein
MAARELGWLSLEDGLQLVTLYAATSRAARRGFPPRFRAASAPNKAGRSRDVWARTGHSTVVSATHVPEQGHRARRAMERYASSLFLARRLSVKPLAALLPSRSCVRGPDGEADLFERESALGEQALEPPERGALVAS